MCTRMAAGFGGSVGVKTLAGVASHIHACTRSSPLRSLTSCDQRASDVFSATAVGGGGFQVVYPLGEMGPVQSELSRSLRIWQVNLAFTFTFYSRSYRFLMCKHTNVCVVEVRLDLDQS